MDQDNGTRTETILVEPILLMIRTTRTEGDLLSEISFLIEMVEAGKEVITPIHVTETGKIIGAPLVFRKAKEETLLEITQSFNHDPCKPTILVFRNEITDKTPISLLMNRTSRNTRIRRHPRWFVLLH